MTARLTPEKLPPWMIARAPSLTVVHRYPDDWDTAEVDQHRYDDCPCSPTMSQLFCTCGQSHGGYRWVVTHRRIPKTESAP